MQSPSRFGCEQIASKDDNFGGLKVLHGLSYVKLGSRRFDPFRNCANSGSRYWIDIVVGLLRFAEGCRSRKRLQKQHAFKIILRVY